MQSVDVAIIGAGPGGLAAAEALASDRQVLVVENNLWGGTCPNFGCDPKKLLYSAVQSRDYAWRMADSGVSGEVKLDWPAMMAFKRGYTKGVPNGTLAGLKQDGIVTAHGDARLIDAHTIAVGEETYHATTVIIATGQVPVIPPIEGAKYLKTSTDFLDLDALPKKIAMIGAGFVGLELANIAASAGAEVHVINDTDRALRQYPKDAVEMLKQAMAEKGIQFHDKLSIKRVEKTETGLELTADDFSLTVDDAFATAGRSPALPEGVEAIGIKVNRGGIVVDEHLETTVAGVFAIGDVIDKKQAKLTPVSSFEGRYVANHLLGSAKKISYPAIPQTIFGSLELAKVGVDLEDALADTKRYEVREEDVTHWFTYLRIGEKDARVWTIVDKKAQTLAGALIVASDTEALSNLFTVMINQGESVSAIRASIYAYPTAASDLGYLV